MITKEIGNRIVYSLLIGLVVTAVSGISANQIIAGELPSVQLVMQPLLGVNYWGYMLPWLKQIVYPGEVKRVIWQNFAADAVLWTIVAYIVLAAFKLPAKSTGIKKSRARKKRRK